MIIGVSLILLMETLKMSRPLKAGLDYFPHDTMAHADPKIRALMALYGTDGYAFYFIVLELVFRSDNGRITIGKLSEKTALAHAMCMKIKRFDQILETALEVGCFDVNEYRDNSVLTSNGIYKRIGKIKDEREKDRKRRESWKEKERSKENKELNNKRETETETETKSVITTGKLPDNCRITPDKKYYGEFKNVKLTNLEYQKLVNKFTEQGAKDRIENLSSGIASKGYKYASHYATILTWERKNNSQPEQSQQLDAAGRRLKEI